MTQETNYKTYREHYGNKYFNACVPTAIATGIFVVPITTLLSTTVSPILLGIDSAAIVSGGCATVGYFGGLPFDGLVAIGLFPAFKATESLPTEHGEPKATDLITTEHGELETTGLLPHHDDNQ